MKENIFLSLLEYLQIYYWTVTNQTRFFKK